jgi:hypothetical protein
VAQGEKHGEGGGGGGGLLRRATSGRSLGAGGSGGKVCHMTGLGRGSAGHRGGRRPAPARERRARATWFGLIRIQIQMNSNLIQIVSKFDPSKKDLPELKKF